MTEDWRTWPMRQRIIQQIDEHLRQTPEGAKKTAQELENSLYTRATKKDEYLQYVSKIIMYLKEQAQNTNQNTSNLTAMLSGQQGNTPGQSSVVQGVAGGGQMTLVNAGGNQMVHSNQPQMAPGGAGGAQMTHGTTSGGQLTHVGLPGGQGVGSGGMVTGQMVNGPNRMQQSMAGNIQTQTDMNNWQAQAKARRTPNDMIRINMNTKHPGMSPMTPVNAQVGKMGTIPVQMAGQNEQVSQMSIGGQIGRQGVTMQQRVPSPSFSIGAGGPHPRQGTPTPTSVTSVSQHGVSHSLTFISPSPTSSTTPSPAGSARGMNQLGAPSPGTGMINTPGQPQQQSPAPNTGNLEDRAYTEKVKQLQHKYLDSLRGIVQKLGGNSDAEKLRKIRNLLEIIENPQRRAPNGMEMLRVCETVLERQFQREPRTDGEAATKTLSKDDPVTVLFEGISLALKSPLGYHTVHRTLSPAIKTLLGPDLEPSLPKKLKVTEQISPSADSTAISETVQGEVARLPPRFKVNLDGHHMLGGDDLTLVCQLDDPNLPCVPPITLIVPPSYPNDPPQCRLSKVDYNTTPFLKEVHEIMTSRLFHVPEICTLTMLLDAWEMSIRRACSSKPFIPDAITPLSNLSILMT